MNWSAGLVAEVPAGVVTMTSTVPVPAGVDDGDLGVAVDVQRWCRWWAEADVGGAGEAAAGDGHLVPAGRGPLVGEIPVTSGTAVIGELVGGLVAEVPPGVVTVTSTVPAPAGLDDGDLAVAVDGQRWRRWRRRS